jgi:hypothetical protein
MSCIKNLVLAAFSFGLVIGAETASAEGVGTGLQQQTSGVTTSSISVDAPAHVRPMEGVGSGRPQASNGATTSSYHFRPFAGIRPMEGVGTGSPQSLATSCVAPASLWAAFACSIFE